MIDILVGTGLFLILYGALMYVQRRAIDTVKRGARRATFFTTTVFPNILMGIGAIMLGAGQRVAGTGDPILVEYARWGIVVLIGVIAAVNMGLELGLAPPNETGAVLASTPEFADTYMNQFLGSQGIGFAGVVPPDQEGTALSQIFTTAELGRTYIKDYQVFGSWETLEPVGTGGSGLFQDQLSSTTSTIPIRALLNMNCRFFHLHCYDDAGRAKFSGASSSFRGLGTLPPSTLQDVANVFEVIKRGLNDLPPVSGSTTLANRDPIILYVELHGLGAAAEADFVKQFTRVLGTRQLAVDSRAAGFTNTTMDSMNDRVVVVFNTRPISASMIGLASGYSGNWDSAEEGVVLKFIRTAEELDDLESSVVSAASGGGGVTGNDVFTALVPAEGVGTVNPALIERAMQLGVNVQCFPLYQPNIGRLWRDRIYGLRRGEAPSGEYFVTAMAPFTEEGAQKAYINDKARFSQSGYVLKPEVVRNPPNQANRSLYPRAAAESSP